MEKGHGAPMPSSGACHSLRIFKCSPTWKLSEPWPSGVLLRLHYIGMIDLNYWRLNSTSNSSPLPESSGGELKVTTSSANWDCTGQSLLQDSIHQPGWEFPRAELQFKDLFLKSFYFLSSFRDVTPTLPPIPALSPLFSIGVFPSESFACVSRSWHLNWYTGVLTGPALQGSCENPVR